jgi:hypothetical protein
MAARTAFLARLIGLFILIQVSAMVLHKQTMVDDMTGLMRDRPLLLIVGMIALALGLAMVLAHNVWSSGPLPIVVTAVGWIFLIRGVLILVLPADTLARLFEMLRFVELYYLYVTIPVALGLYLTWAVFRKRG